MSTALYRLSYKQLLDVNRVELVIFRLSHCELPFCIYGGKDFVEIKEGALSVLCSLFTDSLVEAGPNYSCL